MKDNEILKKLQELETMFAGFAGYYGLQNWKKEKEGKRISKVDEAKADAYGYCADELKQLVNAIKGDK